MISQNDKKFAQSIMEKLNQKPISKPFQNPVDPEKDGCPHYFFEIKKPMCLKKVNSKLENSQYQDLEQWAADVDLIWKNAMTYNKPDTTLYLMAEDLSIWFRKKVILPNNPQTADWITDVCSITKRMKNYFEKQNYSDTKF